MGTQQTRQAVTRGGPEASSMESERNPSVASTTLLALHGGGGLAFAHGLEVAQPVKP